MKSYVLSIRFGVSMCLFLSHLLANSVAHAQGNRVLSAKNKNAVSRKSIQSDVSGGTAAVTTRPVKTKKSAANTLVFSLPEGKQTLLEVQGSYQNLNLGISGKVLQTNNTIKIETTKTDYIGAIQATYGFTDSFYSRVKFSYGKGSQDSTSSGITDSTSSNLNTTTKSDGHSEPEVSIGYQIVNSASRLFTELSVDVGVGDQVTREETSSQKTENYLSGGTSYSPKIGYIQELNTIKLFGGLSYTIHDQRTKRYEELNKSPSIEIVKGANVLNALAGFEFKDLSQLGFVVGYANQDGSEYYGSDGKKTSDSKSNQYWTATSYLGFKLAPGQFLVPQLSYVYIPNFIVNDTPGLDWNGEQVTMWSFSLFAKLSF